MRFLIKLTILGLAGYGVTDLVRRFRPRAAALDAETGRALDQTLEPALQDAVHRVGDATRTAATQVAGASREAAEAVREAASGNAAPAPDPVTTGGGVS